MVAIDHLPTLLPKESSEFFCANLLPSIMELKNYPQARVWADVLALFNKKVAEMQQSY
jgi:saccharopine dehydrogenase (NAD+, L-lysine-forming)